VVCLIKETKKKRKWSREHKEGLPWETVAMKRDLASLASLILCNASKITANKKIRVSECRRKIVPLILQQNQ
jgi:hypothetical protein